MIHLHVHDSEGSLLDSTVRPELLPTRAKELGMKSVAITNHGNMTSSIKFYKACKENGVKPIIGCEMYVCTDLHNRDNDNRYDHLVVIAKNKIGYKNLLKLTNIAHLEGMYYKPRIDMKTLENNCEGLIILSACLGGEIPRLILKGKRRKVVEKIRHYSNIFEHFYLEVQGADNEEQKKVNQELALLSDLLNVPLVATCDVHFMNEDDFEAHGVFIQINQDRGNEFYKDCWFKTERELMDVLTQHIGFEDSILAVANTHNISDLCEEDLITLGKSYLPHFPIPSNFKDENQFLWNLISKGFESRKLNTTLSSEKMKEYQDRVKYEYNVISKKGFSGYFLIVEDFLRRCRDNDIYLGDGRGSADNSLICYLLHITNVDPILYKLNFSRFLTMERIELPDIDMDIQSSKRSKAIQILKDIYGERYVAQIANVLTLQAKAIIRSIGKVLKIEYKEAEKISKCIADNEGLQEALKRSEQLQSYREQYPKLFEMCSKLEGLPRSLSTHAGGVVICPSDKVMHDFTALTMSDKVVITQLDKKYVELVGLVKMDVLATTTLDEIDNTLDLIYGEEQ